MKSVGRLVIYTNTQGWTWSDKWSRSVSGDVQWPRGLAAMHSKMVAIHSSLGLASRGQYCPRVTGRKQQSHNFNPVKAMRHTVWKISIENRRKGAGYMTSIPARAHPPPCPPHSHPDISPKPITMPLGSLP